jgi:phosphomannomutase
MYLVRTIYAYRVCYLKKKHLTRSSNRFSNIVTFAAKKRSKAANITSSTNAALLVSELLFIKAKPLSAIVKDSIKKFPSSGEINYAVKDAKAVFSAIQDKDWKESFESKTIDVLDPVFKEWRLNIESKGKETLVHEKLAEVEKIIFECGVLTNT